MDTFSSRLFLVLLWLLPASAMLIGCGGGPTPTPALLPTLAQAPTNPRTTVPLAPTTIAAPTTAGTAIPATVGATTTSGTAIPSPASSVTAMVGVTAIASVTPTSGPSVTPVTVATAVTQVVLNTAQNPQLGTLLVDAQGMTLYTFKNDPQDGSSCTGDCATLWPPLTVKYQVSPAAPPSISGSLGVFERPDNTYQVTYNDVALYRYSKDTKPGDTNGNGLNGLWSVVVIPPPGSTPVTSTPVPPATPTATGK